MKNLMIIAMLALLIMPFAYAEVASTQANPEALPEQEIAPMKMLRVLDVQEDEQEHCYQANEAYAVYHNGLWWAWLAPVATSGWGALPDASLMGDDWRNVADADEWALRPEATAFSSANKCAASYFFASAPWCDWNDPYYIDASHPNGYVTYYIDGSVSEYWVVHDDCGGEPSNEVPEFGIIGAAIVIVGALGFLIFRKK